MDGNEEQAEITTTIEDHSALAGVLWLGGWLFTIGFTHLSFWRGCWALIVWPYYLGAYFSQ
jgi:hypothetical protein